MLNRRERKEAKAKERWKRYRTRRAVNRNIKKKYYAIRVKEETLRLFHREGYAVQLAPKSKKYQERMRKESKKTA